MRNTLLLSQLLLLTTAMHAQVQKALSENVSKDSIQVINLMIEKAIRIGKQDSSKAESIFHNAVKKANQVGDPYLAGKAYYEMGQMFYEYKNHNHSFGAFFNARPFFIKAGAKKELAYTLYGLGREQYYRGNYKVAAEHLNFAMLQADTMKLRELESDALEYLGILYHLMPGTELESIAQFKKAFSIKEKLGDKRGMLRMLEKLGEVYYDQKKFDSSLIFLTQSISLALSLNLRQDADISRLERVATLIQLHKLEDAKKDLDWVSANSDTVDLNIMVRYLTQLGNLNVAQNRLNEAKTHYDRALQIASRIGVPEIYGIVYKNMADFYSLQGLYKEAYAFSKQYNEQLKGYYAENVGAIKDLEKIFSNSLIRDEVTQLSNENKLKELQLKHERQLRLIMISGAILLLMLSGIIYYLYRKQKNKNALIRFQADELKTLMKEIHHRVKNNLQIISSLLDLQSMMVKDEQASQAIKEGRNRVHSMALIHQNLYGEKDVMAIAVDEYINSLAQNLFNSYNVQQGQVEFETDIERMKLDVDTIIPIGLMLNELISNSLKHAFEKNEKGWIRLTLKKDEGDLLMQVQDSGRGFPKSDNSSRSTAFGMRMIRIFAQKLKADLNIYNDQGACVVMRMKKFKLLPE
ncbi:MAG: histidine kinase dimerization/phosphoacceptor domain -containing protein [Chitinophagales bacterium]